MSIVKDLSTLLEFYSLNPVNKEFNLIDSMSDDIDENKQIIPIINDVEKNKKTKTVTWDPVIKTKIFDLPTVNN